MPHYALTISIIASSPHPHRVGTVADANDVHHHTHCEASLMSILLSQDNIEWTRFKIKKMINLKNNSYSVFTVWQNHYYSIVSLYVKHIIITLHYHIGTVLQLCFSFGFRYETTIYTYHIPTVYCSSTLKRPLVYPCTHV